MFNLYPAYMTVQNHTSFKKIKFKTSCTIYLFCAKNYYRHLDTLVTYGPTFVCCCTVKFIIKGFLHMNI